MKRLLTYLFLVLGLGLVFNNFAFAKCIEGNCRNGQGTYTWGNGTIRNGIWKNGELVERNNIKTQIAKKEPTQIGRAHV